MIKNRFCKQKLTWMKYKSLKQQVKIKKMKLKLTNLL